MVGIYGTEQNKDMTSSDVIKWSCVFLDREFK